MSSSKQEIGRLESQIADKQSIIDAKGGSPSYRQDLATEIGGLRAEISHLQGNDPGNVHDSSGGSGGSGKAKD